MDKVQFKFNENHINTAIVQDANTREVLMMAWMNAKSITLTQYSGKVHFWSRSRNELWQKGATSGNVLTLVEMRVDCDQDTLLVLVQPAGPTCHTGHASCFYRKMTEQGSMEEVSDAK